MCAKPSKTVGFVTFGCKLNHAETQIMREAFEARGFVFGAALAQKLGKGLILIRKPGKLPGETIGFDYGLEYGRDRLELHRHDLPAGAKVLLVDDVLATGGTAEAAVGLIEAAGASVTRAIFVIELEALGGGARLTVPWQSLVRY
mgnify:CR=1 FL=1